MKLLAVIVLAGASSLIAQTDSRAAEIAEQQQQKATQVSPVEQTRTERFLLHLGDQGSVQKFLDGYNGLHPKFGGMAPETGFGGGPEYRWTGRQLSLRTSALFTTSNSRKFDFEVAAPSLSNSLFFTQFNAVHHDYRNLSFYGSGPDSDKTGRTRFHLKDTAVDGTFGIRPFRNFSAGSSVGYVVNDIDLGQAQNYRRVAGFVQYDWRDNPGGPRRGGNYFTQISDYGDFRKLDMEAQQFVSILNQRRVFAFRAKSALTFKDAGKAIPFYMQPMLGGSEDLRGYRPYRFRGDNLFAMNAEYRWEVFSGLDMALFGDAGKVFDRKSDFDLRNLESSVGFGFRFNARNQTFLRMDVGFSHEGFQVWVKFNNLFQKGPTRTSSSMGDF